MVPDGFPFNILASNTLLRRILMKKKFVKFSRYQISDGPQQLPLKKNCTSIGCKEYVDGAIDKPKYKENKY